MSTPQASLVRRALGNEKLIKSLSILKLVLERLPTIFKYLIAAVFLVNFRSWPFAWHHRLYIPIWKYRIRQLLLSLSLILKSKKEKERVWQRWYESLSPVGADPFQMEVRYKTWAGPDDCDLNMHLSNSCYAKNLDIARFIAGIRFCPSIFRTGGWIALGATHFKFVREIPIFSTYEMRTTLATWDHKWLYVLTRYVTVPKNKNKKKVKSETITPPINPMGEPVPDIHMPSTPSLLPPPTPSILPPLETISKLTNGSPLGSKEAILKALASREESDGATLHCLALSECCFKIGRITIPPNVMLACDGYSIPPPPPSSSSSSSSTSSSSSSTPTPTSYSLDNPPPHWETVRAMRKKGDMKPLHEFLKGGWRNTDDCFWEEALSGEIEERRRTYLELIGGVQKAMENVRAVY